MSDLVNVALAPDVPLEQEALDTLPDGRPADAAPDMAAE
ncbi:hypothetical protein BH23PSE1_BH23PSE1_12510 [soil metagenome]